MKKTSRLSERLAEKIKKELGINLNPETFTRTYAGGRKKPAEHGYG